MALSSSSGPRFIASSAGRVLRRDNIGEYTLSDIEHRPGARIPAHFHEHGQISILQSGSVIEAIGRDNVTRTGISVIYRPPGEVHADHIGPDGARFLLIEIEPERLEDLLRLFYGATGPVYIPSLLLDSLPERLLREFSSRGHASSLALEGLINEMIACAARLLTIAPYQRPPAWLERTRRIVEDNFRERWPLQALAREAGVAPTRLSRAFSRFYRRTVGDVVRERRVAAAKTDLLTSEKSIVTIAQETGYFDQAHFSREFRKAVGVTPSAYRKRHRQSAERDESVPGQRLSASAT